MDGWLVWIGFMYDYINLKFVNVTSETQTAIMKAFLSLSIYDHSTKRCQLL